jgi:hypothetical protein
MNSHHLMALGFALACLALLRIGRVLAAISCLAAAAESYACLRYPFHSAMRDYVLDRLERHIGKVELQTVMLTAMAALIALGVLLMLPRLIRLTTGRQMMAFGGLMIVAMFGIELVSLHHVDTIIYQMIGPFAICAIVYFAGALLVTGGALAEAHRLSVASQST